MAKDSKKAAQAAAVEEPKKTQVETTTVDNIEDQIKAGNKFNADLAAKAKEQNATNEENRKVRELAEVQSAARYCNNRELLELKKRRKEDKATKECLDTTKELLDKLEGGELTKQDYIKAIRECYDKKFKAFDEIDKWFNELVQELKTGFDGWNGEWEFNNRNSRCRHGYWD